MPLTIVKSRPEPEDYALNGLFNIERWMCNNCGLILDYKFGLDEPGSPRFEPPLGQVYTWTDEKGELHVEDPEREEFCPRCGISFQKTPPESIVVREVETLSGFFNEGQGEGETLELKEEFSADGIQKTIVAFANTEGGKIILGVTDAGIPVGYKGPERIGTTAGKDELQKRILGLLGSIQPKPKIRVYVVDDKLGRHFGVIVVRTGLEPPYMVNHRAYIRQLNESRPAKPEEIRELVERQRTGHRT